MALSSTDSLAGASDLLSPEAKGASNPRAVQVRVVTRSAVRAGTQRSHDLRIGPQPAYVDTARTDLNTTLVQPLTGTALRAICVERRARRVTKRAMKSSASVGLAGIITFGHQAQPLFLRLSKEAQEAAYREVAEAVAARLNTTLTGLVVHRDESAPHAHFQCPAFDLTGHPVSDKTKRGTLSELQTLAAELMVRHAPGIERGYSKADRLKGGASPSEVVNRSVAELHDDLPHEIAALRAQVQALQGRIAEAEEKAATNDARARKALEKAQADEDKAAKALRNVETYERRARDARADVERLTAEVAAAEARVTASEEAQSKAEDARRVAERQATAAEARRAAIEQAAAATNAARRQLEEERQAFDSDADSQTVQLLKREEELDTLEAELDEAILDLTAGQLDVSAEVERRLAAARTKLEEERQALRPSVRAEVEAEMAQRRTDLDGQAEALRQTLDRNRQEQATLVADQAALKAGQEELAQQRIELARRLRQAGADARAVADLVVRVLTGVVLGHTRPTGPYSVEAVPEDQRLIDRLGLGALLAGAVERLERFWQTARAQLDKASLARVEEAASRAAREAGQTAKPTTTRGMEP